MERDLRSPDPKIEDEKGVFDFRLRRSKMERGSSIFGAEDRRERFFEEEGGFLKKGGKHPLFFEELPSSKNPSYPKNPSSSNPPLLRRTPPFFEESPRFFEEPPLLRTKPHLRSSEPKIEDPPSSIFDVRSRISKTHPSSFFGAEDRRHPLSIFGAEDRRPSHLRSSSPKIEELLPFFRFSELKIEEPFHLQSSIFDPEDRRTIPSSIFGLNKWVEDQTEEGGVGLLRRWGGFFEDGRRFFDFPVPKNEEPLPIFHFSVGRMDEDTPLVLLLPTPFPAATSSPQLS